MSRHERFAPRTNVVWRSVLDDHVGYVFAATVVTDTNTVIALYQHQGGPTLRRGGKRGGPNGRSLGPGAWDGTHHTGVFAAGDVVRAHTPGRPYSVIRRLTPDGFTGWYINLELPWTRTSIGFDTRDLTLDIVFDDDLTTPTWKDCDEHDWNLAAGNITPTQHQQYLEHGHTAITDATTQRHLFATNWAALTSPQHQHLPAIPTTATTLHPEQLVRSAADPTDRRPATRPEPLPAARRGL